MSQLSQPANSFASAQCGQCGGSLHVIGHEWACGTCGMPVKTWEAGLKADQEKKNRYPKIPANVIADGLMAVSADSVETVAPTADSPAATDSPIKPKRRKS